MPHRQTTTLEQIREQGIQALLETLGPVGMVRFLQQSETGWGNYSRDRQQWLNDPSVEDLVKEIITQE